PRPRVLERALWRLIALPANARRGRPRSVLSRREGSPVSTEWVKVDPSGLEVGRVTTVIANGRAVCLTRTAAGYGALDNHCPHQGGPLGDGQIEGDYVICPWHAYEYDPLTGQPPPGFADAATSYAVEQREDGLWVEVPPEEAH